MMRIKIVWLNPTLRLRLRPVIAAVCAGWFAVITVQAQPADVVSDEPMISSAGPEPESQPAANSNGADAGTEAFDLRTTDRLTGDWAGARTKLEEQGITFALGLTTIYQHNVHGGLKTRNGGRVTGSYDLELTFDLGAMKAVQGGTLYMLACGSWDEGLTVRGFTGDLFGVNGDANMDRSIDVHMLWYEQAFLDHKLLFRLGKVNLSYDFDTSSYANTASRQFVNYGLVVNPQIPYPGFAFGHLGAELLVHPTEWFFYHLGVADAQADERETGLNTAFHDEDYFFAMQEIGLSPTFKTRRGALPGNYRVGMWYDPQPKARFFNDLGGRRRSVPIRTDDVGFYLSFDQLVFKERPGDDADEQGLGLFCRYGYARGDVNYIEHFWSVGAQYQGLIPTRDADVLGFAAAQGAISEQVKEQGERPGRETVLELYYSIEVFPWLLVSPDFQLVIDPGGSESVPDAFVAGLRVQTTF